MYQVLLADDEPIFLEYMQNILKWDTFHCHICSCQREGKAALDSIERLQPDIAFLDICMPLMDGIEICRIVKKKQLPVKLILMTGHDEFSFAYQAIKIGIDDYLLKPFSQEELAETLQKILSSINEGTPKENAIEHMGEGSTKYEIMAYAIDEYLNQNYMKQSLSLTTIANDLGFESSYLRRIYKITTGTTIIQKLEDIRISKAKSYLSSGKYQSQEISEMVGFSDQFYFSKRFKKCCGISPSEYKIETKKTYK